MRRISGGGKDFVDSGSHASLRAKEKKAIREAYEKAEIRKAEETRQKNNSCDLALCQKEGELFKCEFCGEHFCQEHIRAKRAGLPNFSGKTAWEKSHMDDWRREDGHPCIAYSRYLEENRRSAGENSGRTWGAPKGPVIDYYPVPQKPKKIKPSQYFNIKVVGVIIIVVIVFIAILFVAPKTTNYSSDSNSERGITKSSSDSNSEGFFGIKLPTCSDGTIAYTCSQTKPFYCIDGNLIERAGACGCPTDFKVTGDTCVKIQRCSDGTEYGTCSSTQPNYCENGIIVQKASVCGCPFGSSVIQTGESCSDLSKPDISYLEQKVHEFINVQRKQNSLSELTFDSKLTEIARNHSQDMVARNFFAHDNPDGRDPTQRANSVGYTCHKDYGSYYTNGIAENIAQNNLYTSSEYINGILVSRDWQTSDEIAQSIVNQWMNSSGHRQNILTSTYDREGIGIAISSGDEVYVTEDFC